MASNRSSLRLGSTLGTVLELGEREKGDELECHVLLEIRSLEEIGRMAGGGLEATYIIII